MKKSVVFSIFSLLLLSNICQAEVGCEKPLGLNDSSYCEAEWGTQGVCIQSCYQARGDTAVCDSVPVEDAKCGGASYRSNPAGECEKFSLKGEFLSTAGADFCG